MPESRQPLDWSRRFSERELEIVARGLVPQQMEDKWFIFLEGDRLFFHRSWTGLACYELRLEGLRVAEAWYNPEAAELTTEQHLQLLDFLVDRLLLDRPVTFALTLDASTPEERAVAAHAFVGYAEPGTPRAPLAQGGLELSRSRLEAAGCELIAYGCKSNGDMKGGPSAEILLRAGPQVQETLRQRLAESSRKLGEVVLTPSFGMRAQGVFGIFHIVALEKNVLGAWISRPEPLSEAMRRTLAACRTLKAHSVAFAALGATKLNISPEGSARFMIQAAREYLRTHPDWPLRILFALPDHQVYQAFLKRLQS